MNNKLRDHNFTRPEDVRVWGAMLSWRCPTCDRRISRHPFAMRAAKVAIGFFAFIGAGGFVMGLKQVLGF